MLDQNSGLPREEDARLWLAEGILIDNEFRLCNRSGVRISILLLVVHVVKQNERIRLLLFFVRWVVSVFYRRWILDLGFWINFHCQGKYAFLPFLVIVPLQLFD